MIYKCQLWLLVLVSIVWAKLPTELDPFMDKLFETDECESFISGDFTPVGTSNCEPAICDFPRQFCVRPASKSNDKSANQCQNIPEECITAANGGEPLGPPMLMITAPPPPPPGPRPMPGGKRGPGRPPGGMRGTARPFVPSEICSMEAPTGRFCGFKVMYTYNKETFQCDEFWFPGCPTHETNSNLFEDMASCQKVAEICKPTPAPFTMPPPPPPTAKPRRNRPFPARTLPAPPPTAPPFPGWGGGGQGGGGLGGGGHGGGGLRGGGPGGGGGMNGLAGLGGLGAFLGSGTGSGMTPPPVAGGNGGEEDLGLLGLIQKGLVSAQAIKQGGPQGKQAAQAAAGQLLQQFTGFDLNNIGGNFGNLFNG